MNFVSKLKEILPRESSTRDCTLRIEAKAHHIHPNCIEITYGQMYDSPTLNFDNLLGLSELFGTPKIDVDNYSSGGCETCDWGSNYGHTIQILNITKNYEEAVKVFDENLYKEGR